MMPYSLTPENDPTAFTNEDGQSFHMCDLPMHTHYVPFPYADCIDMMVGEVAG